MYAGARPRHIFTPKSKVARLSLNPPILIKASLMESSLLPFSQLPPISEGTYCAVSMVLNLAMSAGRHATSLQRMISAARGHCSAHQAACTRPLAFLWPLVSVAAQAFMMLMAFWAYALLVVIYQSSAWV